MTDGWHSWLSRRALAVAVGLKPATARRRAQGLRRAWRPSVSRLAQEGRCELAGPLEGIRVVGFTEIIAGPVAGMLLADLGADVIKVEPPWGDPWRFAQEIAPAESRGFIALNRGKRSITLDLTRTRGREAAHRLVETADVVIVNHRPDVPKRLGIDYETLRTINPHLIYCEAIAFGRKGPDRERPGYDLIVQATTGIIAAEGKNDAGSPGPITSSPFVDFSTGHAMVSSVCAALFYRERTGMGQKIETTLLANALMLQTIPLTRIESIPSKTQAWVEEDLPLLRDAGVAFPDIESLYQERRSVEAYRLYYRTYRTADWVIAVGCLSDPLRKKLLEVLGLHDRRFDADFDAEAPEAAAYYKALIRQFEELFLRRTTAEWLTTLEKAGVPAGPLRFIESMIEDEQARANGMIIPQEHSVVGAVRTAGPVSRFSETQQQPERPSPGLGQHTDEVLAELGYSTDEVDGLRRAGALG